MNRRSLVAAATILFAAPTSASCVPSRTAPRVTWVRLRPAVGGYSIYVSGVEVQLSELDGVVLAHAMAANPGRTEDDLRQNVRIYISGQGEVTYGNVLEVMHHLRFEKVGIVAEDAR
jgi:hypothetical protein